MEINYNSLILGRIPSSGGGICRTYEESIINYVYCLDDKLNKSNQVYLSKYRGIYFGNKEREEDKEMVLLGAYPYGEHEKYFLVELIEKDILHAHLLDERMNIERLINSQEDMALKI